MQHRHRIISMFFVLLALSITFAACGSSDNSSSQTTSGRTQTAQTVTSATRARPTAKDRLVEVFPAIGIMHGVVAHAPNKQHRYTSYTCKTGFKVPDYKTVNYNGTIIRQDEQINWHGQRTQSYLVLKFSGNTTRLAPKAASFIIRNHDYGSDLVINLTPAMVKGGGVKLNDTELDIDELYRLQLCIKP